MKLTPEVKALWLADLRSGKHKQIAKKLFDGDGYCCFGRLCELSGISKWVLNVENMYVYVDDALVPSNEVRKWAGVSLSDGWAFQDLKNRNEHLESPSTLNDFGFTFEQIADMIEFFY